MGFAFFYLRNMRRQVNAEPIWPISADYKLGDFGIYKRMRGKLSVLGNVLDKYDISKRGLIRKSGAKLYLLFNSANAVQNDFTANVSTQPGHGSLEMSFANGRAFVLQIFDAEVLQLVLSDEIRDALLDAAKRGEWHHRYRVVEMIYRCPTVRFVYSMSNSSAISFAGALDTSLQAVQGAVDYRIETSSHMNTSMWMSGGPATPLVSFASFMRRELRMAEEKTLVSDDWYLQPDSSDSYADVEDGTGEPEG